MSSPLPIELENIIYQYSSQMSMIKVLEEIRSINYSIDEYGQSIRYTLDKNLRALEEEGDPRTTVIYSVNEFNNVDVWFECGDSIDHLDCLY